MNEFRKYSSLLIILLCTSCAGGQIVRLQNESGVTQRCEVSAYTALVTGSSSRDSVLNKCITELEQAGFKVVGRKSNLWESNNTEIKHK